MGDPVFDYFAKTELQAVSSPGFEKRTVDAIEQLLDLIGKPVVLVLNSGIATSGWAVADARSKLVKGIVAAEPVAPPIENAERGATGPGRLWGLTNLPIQYDLRSRSRPNCGRFARPRRMVRTSSLVGFSRSPRTSS